MIGLEAGTEELNPTGQFEAVETCLFETTVLSLTLIMKMVSFFMIINQEVSPHVQPAN